MRENCFLFVYLFTNQHTHRKIFCRNYMKSCSLSDRSNFLSILHDILEDTTKFCVYSTEFRVKITKNLDVYFM